MPLTCAVTGGPLTFSHSSSLSPLLFFLLALSTTSLFFKYARCDVLFLALTFPPAPPFPLPFSSHSPNLLHHTSSLSFLPLYPLYLLQGVMVRLMLVLAPVMCVLSGIGVSSLLQSFMRNLELFESKTKKPKKADTSYPVKNEVQLCV